MPFALFHRTVSAVLFHYVYLLRSLSSPDQTYIGYSTDLPGRLATHNRGGSSHTAKYLPWRLDTYIGFTTKPRALEFEAYLKSHSGKAFAGKRLWLNDHHPAAPVNAPREF